MVGRVLGQSGSVLSTRTSPAAFNFYHRCRQHSRFGISRKILTSRIFLIWNPGHVVFLWLPLAPTLAIAKRHSFF